MQRSLLLTLGASPPLSPGCAAIHEKHVVSRRCTVHCMPLEAAHSRGFSMQNLCNQVCRSSLLSFAAAAQLELPPLLPRRTATCWQSLCPAQASRGAFSNRGLRRFAEVFRRVHLPGGC